MNEKRLQELLQDKSFKDRVNAASDEEIRNILVAEGIIQESDEIEIVHPTSGALEELSDEELDMISGGGMCKRVCKKFMGVTQCTWLC